MTANNDAATWPDLAIGLYDKLTGRNAEIFYTFEDLQVRVPRNADDETMSGARWKVDGTVRIRTQSLQSA